MTKLTITNNETNLHHVLCDVSLTQYDNYVIVLPKVFNLNLTMRTKNKPIVRDVLESKWLRLFNKC